MDQLYTNMAVSNGCQDLGHVSASHEYRGGRMSFPLISFNCQVLTKYNVHLIVAALLKYSQDF